MSRRDRPKKWKIRDDANSIDEHRKNCGICNGTVTVNMNELGRCPALVELEKELEK